MYKRYHILYDGQVLMRGQGNPLAVSGWLASSLLGSLRAALMDELTISGAESKFATEQAIKRI